MIRKNKSKQTISIFVANYDQNRGGALRTSKNAERIYGRPTSPTSIANFHPKQLVLPACNSLTSNHLTSEPRTTDRSVIQPRNRTAYRNILTHIRYRTLLNIFLPI